MNVKRVLGTAVRLALAGVAYRVCFAFAFGLLVPAQPGCSTLNSSVLSC